MLSFKTKYRAKCYGMNMWRVQYRPWWYPFWMELMCMWYENVDSCKRALVNHLKRKYGAGTVVPL